MIVPQQKRENPWSSRSLGVAAASTLARCVVTY